MFQHCNVIYLVGAAWLPLGMHAVGTIHAHRFNAVHGRTGHTFGNRFFAKPIAYDEHLMLTFRYIALNPWRAGLVKDHDRWPWSAHA